MEYWWCIGLIQIFCISRSLSAEIIPESCIQSSYVLIGESTRWRINGTEAVCNYSTVNNDTNHSESTSAVPHYKTNQGVSFNNTGQYYGTCTPATDSNASYASPFQVVTAQHKIAVCGVDKSLTDTSCHKHLRINPGDVVYWTGVDIVKENCTDIKLVDDTDCHSNAISMFTYEEIMTDLQEGHLFNITGVYYLFCLRQNSKSSCPEPLLTITVQELDSLADNKYPELIYAHAALMAVVFGFILPLGAFLASLKQLVIHIILQILGQIATTIALIFAAVYIQMNEGQSHFSQVHSIIGLVIIVAVLIIQPFLKLISIKFLQQEGKIWHKRLGVTIVFFGLSNIFLGMLALTETPLYIKILYGVWVIIVVIVFVAFGAIPTKQDKGHDFDLSKENGAYWKSKGGRISLSPPSASESLGPSKLSREVINQRSFIQIRKKSVDMLDTPFSTGNTNNTSPTPSSGRQRKISNVHFGPVVAEQFSPVVPNTPNNISATNFGFGEKKKYINESDDSEDKEEIDGVEQVEQAPLESTEPEELDDDRSEDESLTDNDLQPPTTSGEDKNKEETRKSLDSLASLPSNGHGSVRITRHSSRAHTKASEIFQRSSSFSRPNHLTPSISINSETPCIGSPSIERGLAFSPQRESPCCLSPPPKDNEEEEEKRCPFRRSPNSDSALPLHQRRQRRTGLENHLPKPDNLSIGRATPARSPSRSPTFTRKKKEMLVDNTLRSVMQMSDDAIISANAQGEIVFWSNGAMKMFGYTPGEAIGSSLQMIMPQRYKEKHQNGVNKRTDFALDYIKKHNTAPEEQKHARLYAVHGVSKSGKEFGVEVVVTSFVIEKEIYYTGIITETDKGLTRQMSASSINSEIEIKEKQQKAIVIGTQMKIAHKLQSAEHITKDELQNILERSLKASEFEVPKEDVSNMVDGIVTAADPDESGVVRFPELIDLLAKHRLYISDSGIIAKYGKSKSEGNLGAVQQRFGKIVSLCNHNIPAIVWSSIYLLLSMVILLAGIFSAKEEEGWELVARGFGPLLSFNCVLILLLMSFKGVSNSLKGNFFATRVLPFRHSLKFHILLIAIVAILSIIHAIAHFCSLAFNDNQIGNSTTQEIFHENFQSSLRPAITGILIPVIMIIPMVSSLPCLRKLCRFIGFHSIHWLAIVLFYVVLLIHGCDSFWKWLLPVVVVFTFDRIYLLFVLNRFNVTISKAYPYDETSRTIQIEIDKPKRFKFTPGQFVQLNLPQIGYFDWQPCYISSSNKEEKLRVFLPHCGNLWLKSSYTHFKRNPLNPKPKEGKPEIPQAPIKASISGPFGCGADALFRYQAAVLVCGDGGPHIARSIIQTFLEYRRTTTCHCGCHPALTKLYFIWVTPSGNDYEWLTDFLSDIIEDKHIERYLDIRIYLTNINSPPDELASALLHLGLQTGGPALSVKRPSQPQLSKLHSNTSYGTPDFESLLDFVSMQQGTSSNEEVECGVFTVGDIPHSMVTNLKKNCKICSKKRGPTSNNEMDVNSPYRRKISLSENSPSPPAPQPKEWHITFRLHHLML